MAVLSEFPSNLKCGDDSVAQHGACSVMDLPLDALSVEHYEAWLRIQRSNSSLESPFFHPGYAKAVSRVRSDVRVGIAIENDVPIAFLPFQKVGARAAEPVGGRLNDFHGLIAMPDAQVTLPQMVSAVGLRSWKYHGLLSSESMEGTLDSYPSPYIDTSQGYEHFLASAKRQSSTIKRHAQKFRALERDFGPVRLEHDVRDTHLLEHLICLKRAKYALTKAFDVLSVDWCANLLREVYATNEAGCRGVLSGLYAGDSLIGVHLGIQLGAVLQYWFPVFDPRFKKYSTGTQLILDVARAATDDGVTTIDLSYGPEPFRYRVGTGSWVVARGEVQASPLMRSINRNKYLLDQAIKKLPFKNTIKNVVRSWAPRVGSADYR